MDSNLFTLTPVSTPPEKEGWYDCHHEKYLVPYTAFYKNGKWLDIDPEGHPFEANPTHYLRPISEEKLTSILEDVEMGTLSITNAIKSLQYGK